MGVGIAPHPNQPVQVLHPVMELRMNLPIEYWFGVRKFTCVCKSDMEFGDKFGIQYFNLFTVLIHWRLL
jgi:hypothetical protein